MTLSIQAILLVPDGERLEIVCEENSQYEAFANVALSRSAEIGGKTKDGRTKLAKWSFVPKGSTSLTEPADYFAFALRESWINHGSKKSSWCKSIMQTNKGKGYGRIMLRDEIRRDISSAMVADAWTRATRGVWT